MTAPSFRELSKRDRRRLITSATIRTTLTTTLLLAAYALAPAEPIASGQAYLRLTLVISVVVVVVILQIRSIITADYPDVRAIQAVVTAVAVFIVLFALLYLGLSNADLRTFNQPLNHISAMYFTVTMLSTVGFGDITPQTDSARLIVTVQMLLDLVLVALVVRVFFSAARSRSGR